MMKIKNTGSTRIRLSRTLYLKPGQVLDVANAEGKITVRKHTDVINITPKRPRTKAEPKVWIKPEIKDKKLDLEVKEDDIK